MPSSQILLAIAALASYGLAAPPPASNYQTSTGWDTTAPSVVFGHSIDPYSTTADESLHTDTSLAVWVYDAAQKKDVSIGLGKITLRYDKINEQFYTSYITNLDGPIDAVKAQALNDANVKGLKIKYAVAQAKKGKKPGLPPSNPKHWFVVFPDNQFKAGERVQRLVEKATFIYSEIQLQAKIPFQNTPDPYYLKTTLPREGFWYHITLSLAWTDDKSKNLYDAKARDPKEIDTES